jgi:hypothetical protein
VAFSTRVFCRDQSPPGLSEVVFWLHQHGAPVTISGGRSASDLLSSFWDEVELSYDEEEAPLTVRCFRADAAGLARLSEEVADFVADVGELPESPARAQVLEHLTATRTLILVEFPPEGASAAGYRANGWLMSLFVERAGGLVQADGVGFYDEYDDVVLPLG